MFNKDEICNILNKCNIQDDHSATLFVVKLQNYSYFLERYKFNYLDSYINHDNVRIFFECFKDILLEGINLEKRYELFESIAFDEYANLFINHCVALYSDLIISFVYDKNIPLCDIYLLFEELSIADPQWVKEFIELIDLWRNKCKEIIDIANQTKANNLSLFNDNIK